MEKADILEMAVKHLKALRETVNSTSTMNTLLQLVKFYHPSSQAKIRLPYNIHK